MSSTPNNQQTGLWLVIVFFAATAIGEAAGIIIRAVGGQIATAIQAGGAAWGATMLIGLAVVTLLRGGSSGGGQP